MGERVVVLVLLLISWYVWGLVFDFFGFYFLSWRFLNGVYWNFWVGGGVEMGFVIIGGGGGGNVDI